ncbi:hypothetical protein D3C79_910780 [compost metagenome]
MTNTGGRQRAVQAYFDAPHLRKLAALAQALDEQCCGAHGADGMGTGWANADLEQVEHTDGHATYLLNVQPECAAPQPKPRAPQLLR